MCTVCKNKRETASLAETYWAFIPEAVTQYVVAYEQSLLVV